MTDPNSDSIDSLQFPEACPWGIAVYADSGARLLKANAHMSTHYLDANPAALGITDQFRFRNEAGWSGVISSVFAGKSWMGRVTPWVNKHGINSVELMIHADAKVAGRIWVYTMEHPSVNGELRFSSRSEMKILQTLLDNTLEYVFIRDADGRFIITNRAFRTAVAFEGSPLPVGEDIATFVSPQSSAWIEAIDKELIEKGEASINKITHFVFKNGTEHWLQMTTVPVRSSEGFVVGSVSVARDINDLKRTEADLRKAIEKAKDASRAKGQFLAAMSHEIRTPINGIVGASELCLDTSLDVEQRDYLETVVQCSSTLMSLINDVLDFSKIEAGQLSLEKLSFCPITLLEDVADEFSQTARQKGLEIVVSYDDKIPASVMGDPTRVKQVIYNLVGNAIKFTDSGEVTLLAETVFFRETDACIRFSVTDTGIGIEESRRKAIFGSFTQGDMSTTRKYGGTGLGLTICKELVELMRGTIDVVSVIGKGSTFAVEIPFECHVKAVGDTNQLSTQLEGLRVLVVDDNKTNRDIYAQMCLGWGFRSSVANSSHQALDLLEEALSAKDPYRLILLDNQMPGVSGLDLADQLHARPDMGDTHILLLSSSLDRSETERAEALGVARALSKPVRRSTLLDVILETFEVDGLAAVSDAKHASAFERAETDVRLRVLLAEDNPINQNIACRRLEKLGHHVIVASDGSEVLKLLKENVFDCILMDIQMPVVDGYQATHQIRAREAKLQLPRVFIIAMTAHAMKGDRERCIKKGMDEYISKPFRISDLRAVLARVKTSKATTVSPFQPKLSANADRVSFAKRLLSLDIEDRGDVCAVGAIFVQTLPAEVERLGTALRTQDCQQIHFVVHSLKGVTSIFISAPCVELAEVIEQACNEKDIEKVNELSAQFIEELHFLAEEIQEVL